MCVAKGDRRLKTYPIFFGEGKHISGDGQLASGERSLSVLASEV